MQDEAPDGQAPLPGDANPPDSPWWPWPETQADELTGPRDGAPGVDETLTEFGQAPTAIQLDEPAGEVTVPPAAEPEPGPQTDLQPDPQPEPQPAVQPQPEFQTELAIEPQPDPGPEASLAAPAVVAKVAGPVSASVAVPGSATPPPAAPEVPATVNEAIPAVPPTAGTGPIGAIPAAHARAVWSRMQALNWRLFLIRFLSAGLAVVVTVVLVPGLGFVGWRWGEFLRIAFVFGLLNATVKPLLQFLVLRFIFSTYGIVVVAINTLLLLLLGAILNDTFEVYRPIALIIGGLVVGILGLVFETLLGATPPVLDRDYKERNGLT